MDDKELIKQLQYTLFGYAVVELYRDDGNDTFKSDGSYCDLCDNKLDENSSGHKEDCLLHGYVP